MPVNEQQYIAIPNGDGWVTGPGPGWYSAPWQPVGYEEHDGAVFMAGALYNQPQNSPYEPVGTLLLTVPPRWRPAHDVTISTPVWVVEYVNSSEFVVDIGTPPYDPPALIDVTVGADGSITLGELPPAINDVPLGQHQQFGYTSDNFNRQFCYQIPLGGLTWRIKPATPHAIRWLTLAPYLGDNFENIDAEYAIDSARLLMRGRVRAKKNGAGYGQPLLSSLPPNTTSLLNPKENFFTVELETSSGDPRVTTYACRVAPSVGSHITDQVILLDDTHYIGNAAPYRYRDAAEPWWTWAMPFNADDVVPWGLPGGPSPVVYAANDLLLNPWTFFTYDSDGNITGFNSNYSQGDNPGWSTIAGVMVNPRNSESVQSSISGGLPWSARTEDASLVMGLNTFDITATVDIATLIANFDPQPDWVAVAVGAVADLGSGAWLAPPDLSVDGAMTVSAGDLVDPFGVTVDGSYSSGSTGGATEYRRDMGAWVIPSGGGGYDADTYNPYCKYLWRPGDAPSSVSMEGHGTVRYAFPFGGFATVIAAAAVYPFYEIGKNWILGGDVIRLDGAGWQLPWTPVTTVVPGLRELGILERTLD